MTFNPMSTPVDAITLGGLKSPGIAKVIGAGSRRKVDVRTAYGISATVAVWLEVAEFKVEILLVTDADWAAWHTWRAAVLREIRANRRNRAGDFAVDIGHPFLAMFDIKAVIVKSISQPEETDPNLYKVTIEFIEYRKITMSLSKPEGAKQKPKDGTDLLLDSNSTYIKALNNELAGGPKAVPLGATSLLRRP